jgi:hypothetical protein
MVLFSLLTITSFSVQAPEQREKRLLTPFPVHDNTKELTVYQFSDVIVDMVSERDRFSGSEICVLVPSSREHFVIRDGTKEQEAIQTCR